MHTSDFTYNDIGVKSTPCHKLNWQITKKTKTVSYELWVLGKTNIPFARHGVTIEANIQYEMQPEARLWRRSSAWKVDRCLLLAKTGRDGTAHELAELAREIPKETRDKLEAMHMEATAIVSTDSPPCWVSWMIFKPCSKYGHLLALVAMLFFVYRSAMVEALLTGVGMLIIQPLFLVCVHRHITTKRQWRLHFE